MLCASSLGSLPGVGFVGTDDDLRDRLDRRGAPWLDVDEGVAIFEADGRHHPQCLAFAGRQEVRSARLVRHRSVDRIGTDARKRRPDFARGIGIRAPPIRFTGRSRIGTGHAAQQAVGRRNGFGRIGCRPQASAGEPGDRIFGVERRGVARQAGEVALVAELAAEDVVIDHVGIIDHGRDHRHLALVTREAQIIDRARVEIAAIADAGEVELRDRVGRQVQERAERIAVLGQPVVGHEVVVRQQHAIESPYPFVVERELALGLDAAAELTVARLTRESAGVGLVDAIGADLIRSVQQPLAELGLEQHALIGGEARIEGRVIIRRDRPVERGFNAVAVGGVGRDQRHQEAVLRFTVGSGVEKYGI